MAATWDIEPEVLIVEVGSRPILYAKNSKEYSNKLLKNSAWEDVTKTLSNDWKNLTKEEKNSRCRDIQAKWKHIRDNFRREYQAQNDITLTPGAKKRKKKYRYYDELLFLIPHVKDSRTPVNNNVPTNEADKNANKNESPSSPKIEISLPGPSTASRTSMNNEHSFAVPSTATHNVIETLQKKSQTTSSIEEAILKAINNQSDTDEDKHFCLSLVQSLKKMNDENKILAKIEILNVLRAYSNRSYSQPNSPPVIETKYFG